MHLISQVCDDEEIALPDHLNKALHLHLQKAFRRMNESFKAVWLNELPPRDGSEALKLTSHSIDDLSAGDTVVEVVGSGINYKDAMAVTGRKGIIRRFPMIPGIDLAGRILSTSHPDWSEGEMVLVTGNGLGETHTGGWAQRARVPGDWLLPLPQDLLPLDAMRLGTAGLTAALCVAAIERAGVSGEQGPIAVTGATGGVGSIATLLLTEAGYEVHAVTGRPGLHEYIKSLGAKVITDTAEFSDPIMPLDRGIYAGVVDTVGGAILARLISRCRYRSAIAACGMACDLSFSGSLAPFILRGVSLIGIDSVRVPKTERESAWNRLARAVDRKILHAISRTIPLSRAPSAAASLLERRSSGRIAIEISS